MIAYEGNKEILISQISSVQFKNTGMLTSGYIQFGFLGGTEARGGLMQATQDENSVMFNKKQQKDFESIKRAIDEKIRQTNSPVPRAPVVVSELDEIEKLVSLRDRGILTPDEFEAKKKQLLGL